MGFDVKASFASRPVSRLIRWYNKPGDITKGFWEKAIQFHGTFHGLKITNSLRNILRLGSEINVDVMCAWILETSSV